MDFDKNKSEGWNLILFLSMFFNAYLTKGWRESGLKETYRSTADFLDEMRPLRAGDTMNAAQKDICRAFGITGIDSISLP